MSDLSEETLEANLKIGLFLEDIAQQLFITCLIRKVVAAVSDNADAVEFAARNASGGIPKMQGELRRYVHDYLQSGLSDYDLVVISQDTDCAGVPATKTRVSDIVTEGYAGPLVIAAPDPCIEAWYLADQAAIRTVAQAASTPPLPRGCDCNALKAQIHGLFREGGVNSPLGGAERAEEIVEAMDINRARQNAPSLNIFVSDLMAAIASPAPSHAP